MLLTLLIRLVVFLLVIWLADHLWTTAWNYRLYLKMKAQGVVFLSGKFTVFGDVLALNRLRQKYRFHQPYKI